MRKKLELIIEDICNPCPFYHVDEIADIPYCKHPNADEQMGFELDGAEEQQIIPDWCPLPTLKKL